MYHPENAEPPSNVARQTQSLTTPDLASGADSSGAHGDPAGVSRNCIPACAADLDGTANILETSASNRNSEDAQQDSDDASVILYGVAEELVRAHRLSLDLQGLFSRALIDIDLKADEIKEAQGLDRLSQILENLARLMQLISKAHPKSPCDRQIEKCLTLKELQLRLGGRVSEPRPVSGSASESASTEGHCRPIATPAAERCTTENGEISWL